MIAHRIVDTFGPQIRGRGDGCIHRIETWQATAETAHVVMRASAENDYLIDLERHGPGLEASCTCPFFIEGNGGCQHIWAVLRYFDREDIQTTAKAETIAFILRGGVPVAVRGRSEARTPWQTVLGDLDRGQTATRAPVLRAAHDEVVYIIDVAASRERLVVFTMMRQRTTARPQPLEIENWQARELPRGDDRLIVGLLTSLTNRTYANRARYDLPHEVAEILLPRLAKTGRLLSRVPTAERGKDELVVTSYDAKRLLERLLHVAKRDMYVMTVVMDLDGSDAPAMLLASNTLAYVDGVITRVAPNDGKLIDAVQARGEVAVPLSDRHKLSRILYMHGPADLVAPDELHANVVDTKPIPMLFIEGHQSGQLFAQAAFRYGDTQVPVARGAGQFFATDKVIVRRDYVAEEESLTALTEVFGVWERSAPQIIVARQLSAAVERLGRAGFEILAHGKHPRLGTTFDVRVQSGVDWFELGGSATFASDSDCLSVSLPTIMDAIANKSPFVVLDDGTMGLIPEEWLERYVGLVRAAALADEGLRFAKGRAAVIDALLPGAIGGDAAFVKARRELRSFRGIKAVSPKKAFIGSLRPYQREGLGWLLALDRFGLHGCLADEMGLGKTVQVLAWLASRKRNGPVLVVTPRSVVHNWVDEARRFVPGLSIYEHIDAQRSIDAVAKADVILTSYGTMVRDRKLLERQRFDVVILDEAQVIKNATTVTAKVARSLRANRRLALSGTPIENHLGELWSIFEFLSPGLLGTAEFQRLLEADARRPEPEMRELVAAAVRPFILRRTKAAVTPDLPDKQEQTILIDLGQEQRAIYENLFESYRDSLFAKVDEVGVARSQVFVLEALLRLRQAACHPALVATEHATVGSAKLEALFEMLEDVTESAGKVLIFSQFTSLLAFVRQRLPDGAYLDGQTKNRAAVVERFQTDPTCRVMLVSLKAGGTGLNLTAADYVFMLDPWWNPAAEAQAIDRAHRIGRVRPVFAYRLVARNTIEERILELQSDKTALAESILGAKGSVLRGMTRQDLEALFAR